MHLTTKTSTQDLDSALPHLGRVVSNHLLDTLPDGPPRLPLERLFGPGGVRSSSEGIILRKILVDDADPLGERVALFLLHFLDNVLKSAVAQHHATYPDSLGKFKNRELVVVSHIDRSSFRSVHEENQPIHEIVNILEGSGLTTVTVNGHVLPLERLNNKVGDDTAVVRVHSRAKSVEDTGDPDVDIVLPLVTVGKGLGDTLAFVVAGTDTDAVDIAPVFLSLRVLGWVTVNFRGRGDEEPGLGSLGETEHVKGTLERGLERFDRVVLVVRGRSGAGQVVDF